MSDPLSAVVDAVATYRIVRLIQQDTILDGPRERIELRYGDHPAAELLRCSWCASVWVAAGVVIARHVAPRLWGKLASALAFSAVTGVITGLVDLVEHADQ